MQPITLGVGERRRRKRKINGANNWRGFVSKNNWRGGGQYAIDAHSMDGQLTGRRQFMVLMPSKCYLLPLAAFWLLPPPSLQSAMASGSFVM
jgi:hypothetical protein